MFTRFIWERIKWLVAELVKEHIKESLSERGIYTYRLHLSREDQDLVSWNTCNEIPYHVPTHVQREIEKKTDDIHRDISQLRSELRALSSLAWNLGFKWDEGSSSYVPLPKRRRKKR